MLTSSHLASAGSQISPTVCPHERFPSHPLLASIFIKCLPAGFTFLQKDDLCQIPRLAEQAFQRQTCFLPL